MSKPLYKLAIATSKTHLATKFYYYEFETVGLSDFKPGQYISVKVADLAVRSYSVVDVYDSKIGLLVDISPGGPGSCFFRDLSVGDEMRFLGPFGKFFLKEDSVIDEVHFFATGSGIAPVRSMLDALLTKRKSQALVSLYFGLSSSQDIIWKDYFEMLSKIHPNFSYIISLSRPDSAWEGEIGHITKFVYNIKDTKSSQIYLCGNPNMITEMETLLTERNVSKENIYKERFFD